MTLSDFQEVWCADFEYSAQAGEHPSPACLVAREYHTGRLLRIWQDELLQLDHPPFPIGRDSLFVGYFASAEMSCFRSLGWSPPDNILDLYVEFRAVTSGLPTPHGRGLLGALLHHGLPAISTNSKLTMRQLAMRGGPYTPQEQQALMDYCQSDVDALVMLLTAMLPRIDLTRAVYRGWYMVAVAGMETTGVPIDTERLALFRQRWEGIKLELVARTNNRWFGVYDGLTFKADRWQEWLKLNDLAWPSLPSGRLALDRDTFRDMARINPVFAPIYELRAALAQVKLHALPVGGDGRNRCMLSPYSSKTGRNQPSTTKFVFGLPSWLRSLIRPTPGMALGYIDWSQQELGIAAALSGDKPMQDAYRSGDFYLRFGQMAGVIPAGATKESHEELREQFKTASLGVLYGLSEWGLGNRLGNPALSQNLMMLHRQTFKRYWDWSQLVRDTAMLTGRLETVFGWPVHAGKKANPRSLMNFPMQGNGAEMLRLACSRAVEQGIAVCVPVHDAVLVQAPMGEIETAVARMQGIMVWASTTVLNGFELRSDAKIIRYPDRYRDKRGSRMWGLVCELCGVPS